MLSCNTPSSNATDNGNSSQFNSQRLTNKCAKGLLHKFIRKYTLIYTQSVYVCVWQKRKRKKLLDAAATVAAAADATDDDDNIFFWFNGVCVYNVSVLFSWHQRQKQQQQYQRHQKSYFSIPFALAH